MGFFIFPYIEKYGFKLAYTGAVLALFYLVSGLAQIPLIRWMDKKRTHIFNLSACLSEIAFVILFLGYNRYLILLDIVFLAFGMAGIQTWVAAQSVVAGRSYGMGRTMGFLNTANSTGMIICSVVFGMLPVGIYSYRILFAVSGIISLLLIGYMLSGIEQRR